MNSYHYYIFLFWYQYSFFINHYKFQNTDRIAKGLSFQLVQNNNFYPLQT